MGSDDPMVRLPAIRAAGRLFVALTMAAVLFQTALALGAPWGKFAWGGQYPGVLPGPIRMASAASALLLLGLGAVILVRAGLVRASWWPASRKLAWFVVVFCGASVVANAMTPSPWERAVWLPVTVLMLVSSVVVARARDAASLPDRRSVRHL